MLCRRSLKYWYLLLAYKIEVKFIHLKQNVAILLFRLLVHVQSTNIHTYSSYSFALITVGSTMAMRLLGD